MRFTLPLLALLLLVPSLALAQARMPDEYLVAPAPKPPKKKPVEEQATPPPAPQPTQQPVQPTPQPAQQAAPAAPAPSFLAGGTVTGLKFYAAGPNGQEKSKREYKEVFNSSNTKYIYYDLGLAFPQPIAQYKTFDILAVCTKSNGREIYRFTQNSKVEVGWKTSTHSMGWGRDPGGTWEYGTYTVKLYSEGKEIASGSFRVY
ncbi:hypothetical protein NNJEOMEG_03819 [Fundidesulfovibrio magnetotacticus]|uniref:FlgD Ig-like domain-containing protein n=1 Tax=Fundidesulfovibrio magnetotacticus TaxID=2730080 RepID=A0A6V8M1Y2_9BACT|nr:hypothetical protein [Fundidesulfovibrio magnetotacticus]GFK95946.1 hypothetical protein NNJEOMEG_03819 [Fundidesulfovibrio magnetotacticus]